MKMLLDQKVNKHSYIAEPFIIHINPTPELYI